MFSGFTLKGKERKKGKGSNHHKAVFQTVGDREGMSVYGAVIVDGEMAHRLSVAESGEESDVPTVLCDTRSRRC